MMVFLSSERRTIMLRPSQGFWGFREKGYLFSGIWGEGSFIFRDLGRKHNFLGFYGAGSRGLRKNNLVSWGERSFFFQGAGSKDPPWGEGSMLEKSKTLIHWEVTTQQICAFDFTSDSVTRGPLVLRTLT